MKVIRDVDGKKIKIDLEQNSDESVKISLGGMTVDVYEEHGHIVIKYDARISHMIGSEIVIQE